MKRILIVDDQEFIRTLIKARLEPDPELSTMEASNGDEAMMSALTYKPDLIFLDIVMPKIDGLTILQDLKKTEETKHIPIIVVSSYADDWNKNKAIELGVDEFVDKASLESTDFVAIVKKYTETHPNSESNTSTVLN